MTSRADRASDRTPAVKAADFETATVLTPPSNMLDRFGAAVDPVHRMVAALNLGQRQTLGLS